MRDRPNPCIYYICAHAECRKHVKDVTLDKCKNCTKYRGRKNSRRPEPVSVKRRKDKDRHDDWRTY